MQENSKIMIAGSSGLVGSALIRELKKQGYNHFIPINRQIVDLTDYRKTELAFDLYKPDYVFLCAARVGGIVANSTYPAEFISENLKIQTNVIDLAYKYRVKKLLFAGSGCIYPRDCEQPIREEYLLTGPLEKTNEAYAVAKIAGLKMCEFYRKQYGFDASTVMPANIYGPGDNFSLETSHVIPALIRKFSDAVKKGDKEVVLWGTGKAKREFMHVDDLASAMVFIMQQPTVYDMINIGSNEEVSIADLANSISEIVQYEGNIVFDQSKPDGTPRKLLDGSRLRGMGWFPHILLNDGLKKTWDWYLENWKDARK